MASLWELSTYFAAETATGDNNTASINNDIFGVTAHLVTNLNLQQELKAVISHSRTLCCTQVTIMLL